MLSGEAIMMIPEEIESMFTVLNEIRNCTKRVFNTVEAANYLGMSEEWLKKCRRTGGINGEHVPKFVKLKRSVKYLKEDLDEYLNSLNKYEHLAQVV